MDASHPPVRHVDAAAGSSDAGATRRLFAPGRRALVVGAVALVSMIAFEALAVAAAMPAIAAALDGLSLYALAFGGTLATSMLGMVLAGADADRHGPLRAMALGMALFGAGLLMAGLAVDMPWLVVGRIVQGLGIGMIGVAIYVACGRLLPEALRPRLFALFAAAWVLPAIIGPGLAALLVETLGWRWVFLLVALILLPTAVMVLPSVARLGPPEDAEGRTGETRSPASRWVWATVAALSALWLHHASQLDRAVAPGIAETLEIAIACVLIGFAARHLLPRGTLCSARGLPTVIALRGLLAAAFFNAEVFIPLWLTERQGWSIAEAGLALSTGALCWSAGSAVQARIEDPARRLQGLRLGLLLVTVGIAGIATLVLGPVDARWLLPCWALTGLGIGLAFPMLSVLTLQLSPVAQQGAHASALQLSDALATTCLLAVSGALFGALHGTQPTLAFFAVFLAAALSGLLGAVLTRRCRTD